MRQGRAIFPIFGFYVDLQLTDTGSGMAKSTDISSLAFRTLAGTGTVTYNPVLSGTLPISIGPLGAGHSTTIRLYLNVPAGVDRFFIAERGTLYDGIGDPYLLAVGQTVIPATATSVVSSPNPSSFGQAVTFTATVTPDFGASPTGAVTFLDGFFPLATRALTAGKATFVTSTLAVGVHAIMAVYSGSGGDTTSASQVVLQTVK